MSLHYLLKLEMLIVHVTPMSCYRKKLQNLFHLSCGPQVCQIWIQLITACGEYWNRRCTKYASPIWIHWNSDQR